MLVLVAAEIEFGELRTITGIARNDGSALADFFAAAFAPF